MRANTSAVFAFVAFTLGAWPVGAQEAKTTAEVTPYVGLGSAGASPVGAAVTFPVTSTLNVETDVAYRQAEGNIHAVSSSVSLLYSLPRVGRATPYLAGGVGLSQYGAPVFSANGGLPIGTQPSVALTVNAGGGLKMAMNEKLDLRTDARWFQSFGRHGSEQFRVAQGISFDVGKR
jgi:opacity protein-like surface antigen